MSGINWAAVAQSGVIPQSETAALVGYELFGERWKEIKYETIILNRLCNGPYLLKSNGHYYCGNDDVYKRKQGEFIFSLIEKNFKKLILHGMVWSDVLSSSFKEAKLFLDAIEIFGGGFIARETKPNTGRNLHLFNK